MRCGRTFKEAVHEWTRVGCASGPYDDTIERFQARYVEPSDWHLEDRWYWDMDVAIRPRPIVDEWREVVTEAQLAELLVAWGVDGSSLDHPERVHYPNPPRVELNAACCLLDDLTGSASDVACRFEHIESLPATAAILAADQLTQMSLIRETIDRLARMRDKLGGPYGLDVRYMNLHHQQGYPRFPLLLTTRLLRRKFPWSSEALTYLLDRTADLGMVSIFCVPYLPGLVSVVAREAKVRPITDGMRRGLVRLRKAAEWQRYRAPERRLCERLSALAEGSGS
jgi:hypothetical protein